MLGDVLENSKCSNKAAIEAKQFRKELMKYFTNKGAIEIVTKDLQN